MKKIKDNLEIAILSGLFAGLLVFVAFAGAGRAFALSNITTSLDIGSTGADVTTLQTFLAQDPSIYPQGLITGYFGPLTAAAVKNFQNKYGISPVGRVGPITRTEINELIASGGIDNDDTTISSASNKDPAIFNLTTTLSPNYSSGSTNSTVNVTWQTDRNATGEVFYSTSPLTVTDNNSDTSLPAVSGTNVQTMSDNSYTSSKSIALSNLWPTDTNAPYYYMIESVDANGNISVSWPRALSSNGVSQ